jgi:exo-beta-1,3-glucanase (GH17 family)/cellulose synthase/poly-beta-1,6-N-acetylglucosamine synthase-like glycosyltransferase
MKKKVGILIALVLITLLVALNFSIWSYVNNPLQLQPWAKTTMGLTYDPRRKYNIPISDTSPSTADIDGDLALLENKVYAVRTYTVAESLHQIPQLAKKHNLNLAIGAWIGIDLEENRKEIDALRETLQGNTENIVRILVGNEVLVREDVSEQQLIDYIREVKQFDNRLVSTSDTWDRWLSHPKLVAEVDFIAAHILPYWEGISADDAVDVVFDRYEKLKKAYPGKSIIITETGWPSDGQPFGKAIPSRTNQAKFLREFIQRADEDKVNYYIVEAFDQPWKASIEGSVGAYWGVFNSDGHPKYPLNSNRLTVPGWQHWAVGASILSAALMGIILFARRSMKLPGILFLGLMTNLAASTIFWTVSIGAQRYQTKLSLFFFGLTVLMQVVAALILLVESVEIVEVIGHRKKTKLLEALSLDQKVSYPKVSLHLPIHNEPPEMVRETLEAIAHLDYPNLEVLVIDNNTKDPAIWQPVREDCLRLGPNFRFFHLDNWPGFKAGAINYALNQTSEDAEIIAVIDSDYKVSPDWLRSMVPYFDNEKVAFVQSPQDYRDNKENAFKECCYWEYAGFFNIGMVQRNEHNAIIQHGTMTLIRKSALLRVGRWGEWCICEDTELGLRLYEAGYDSVYVNESRGKGLMPDTFAAYRGQRFRWVYGAMQIIKKHWRSFLPMPNSPLTVAQRYYFLAGWLPWFSDALALIFTLTSLLLTGILLYDPVHSELPTGAFLLPTIGLFSFKILRGLWLYRARVPCSILQTLGAFLSGLSLTHTVARGVLKGLFTNNQPFLRTPKNEKRGALLAGLAVIRQELLLLLALVAAIIAMSSIDHFNNLIGKLWITVLSVQMVPYLATLIVTLISIWPAKRK